MSTQTVPYELVETWLKSSSSWHAKADIIQEKLNSLQEMNHKSSSVQTDELESSLKISGSIELTQPGLKEKEKELLLLRARVSILNKAIQALTEEERQFVEFRYINRYTTDQTIEHMQWSHRTFYRKRREVLRQIYHLVGGIDACSWFSGSPLEDYSEEPSS